MKGAGISLAEFADELGYAAKEGAAKLSAAAVARGNVQAKVGVGVDLPGPGLQSALARHQQSATRTSNATNPARIPRVADSMAGYALRQGAKLLSGGEK